MKEFIKLYVIPFLVLMTFQCGFVYGILTLSIGEINPLNWYPVIYILFFGFVLFIGYRSCKILIDNDEFEGIENNHYDYHKQENKNNN